MLLLVFCPSVLLDGGRLKDDAVAMVEEQGDYTSFWPSLTMKSGVTGDGRTMSDCRATSSTPTVGQGPLQHLEIPESSNFSKPNPCERIQTS